MPPVQPLTSETPPGCGPAEVWGAEPTWQLVTACVALTAVLVALGVVVLLIRRRTLSKDSPRAGDRLAELSRLLEGGLISEAEFRRARRALLGVDAGPAAGQAQEHDGQKDQGGQISPEAGQGGAEEGPAGPGGAEDGPPPSADDQDR